MAYTMAIQFEGNAIRHSFQTFQVIILEILLEFIQATSFAWNLCGDCVQCFFCATMAAIWSYQ